MSRSSPPPQGQLAHPLPEARLVDRIPFLLEHARGRRVVHVGFADAGYREFHQQEELWLHEHLAPVAADLVGVDLDEQGVAEARERGYEAYAADCCVPEAVRALAVDPAEVVIAGEIVEHLDDPGGFLDAMHELTRPGGLLVVTTPNACGWVNPMALLGGLEVNHPDHVLMFTWFTLTNMLRRHGWEPVQSATFVPSVKALSGASFRMRVLGAAARLALWIQRAVARWWAPFAADGLIVVARRPDERPPETVAP